MALAGVFRLLDGQTSAGSVVYLDRVDALPDGTTRAVLIEPVDEEALTDESGFDQETRSITVRVTAIATTPEIRDDLSLEIELAMVGGETAGLTRGRSGAITFSASADGATAYYTAAIPYAVIYTIGMTSPSNTF